MKALQYRTIGGPPELVDVPRPSAGPGQVLLRMTAAGVCHSDELIMSASAADYRFGDLPLTLGHEGAGVVAELGAGVAGFEVGDDVLVYGPWGCGLCHSCAQGLENYCPEVARTGFTGPGIGTAGAMAEYMIVDSPRHLVRLDGLDPISTVSLTDAGLTPYHAVKSSLRLLGPGSTAVVIGCGGLGHVAVELVKVLSAALVIAVDISAEKLRLARDVGADETVVGDDRALHEITELTGGRGADVVLDFVGTSSTLELGAGVVAQGGDLVIVGIGGGRLVVSHRYPALEASVRSTYWGSRSELIEVVELARRDQVKVQVEVFTLDEAVEAYARLARGEIRGRAVVVPSSAPSLP